MLDLTEIQGAVVFDVQLLLEELSFISGPHSDAMMGQLAASLERDVKQFFPQTYYDTHIYKFVEFLRRIERN